MKVKYLTPLIFICVAAFGGDLKYPVSDIPAELKAGVDAVVREDFMSFRILARNRAKLTVHLVVSILNKNGNAWAEQEVGYDKLRKVTDISGTVYDASGKQIKKLKNKDISDRSSFDGVSLFSDNRTKSIDLSQSTYPYTIEFDYEMDYNFLLSIPPSYWGGEAVSYQNASYELSYPVGFPITRKLINLKDEPEKKIEASFETLTWKFSNLPPIKREVYGPPASELMPAFVAVPNVFEYSGYVGTRDTWLNFGKWQIELNKGRDQLPEKTIAFAKDLVKNAKTTEEKAKLLYQYLQSRTRYVGIQLGIGGLQPFEAKLVDEVGYGDCKALSNYMVALLKAVGVKGYYCWIFGGENSPSLIPGITVDVFNHIVVAVPNGPDTLWLECTNQTVPFGYQGRFTGDRAALMITDKGGEIVRTNRYNAEQNLQSRTAQLNLDATGNAHAKIKTTYCALQYENGGLDGTFNDTDRQRKWVEHNTDIPNFSINSFSITEKRDKIPSAVVNLDLQLNRLASIGGKRLFISPNLMNRSTFIPPKLEGRRTDVVVASNYQDLDTINYVVPENLYPEFIPEPVKINSRFGEYEASVKFDAGKVTYIRRMKVWKGRFPKESYQELIDFYKGVSKADNIKLVFLNKT